MGYSAALWLHFTDAKILSLDISSKAETLHAAKVMTERYPDRFEFMKIDSKIAYETLKDREFDMAFIDGDHLLPGVIADIKLVLGLGIKNICFDDYLPQFGQVQDAIVKFPIQILEVMGNIALGRSA